VSTRTAVDLPEDELRLGAAGTRWAWIFLALGILGLGVSFALAATTPGGWKQFFPSYLVSFVYFVSLGLGALFFVLVQHVTRAGWSVAVRRLAEAVAPNLLLPMAVLVLPVLAGLTTLYTWTDSTAVAHDPALAVKSAWLNPTFFYVRTALYFAIWGGLSLWFFRTSTRQDRTGNPRLTVSMEKTSTAGLILFAFTTTFFSFDYLMSLTPKWSSTIFGVYFFAGCVLTFFAFLTVMAYAVQGAGALRSAITSEHYHDMGKLVFAFVVFWAYIGFSQYMLMWYANLPEETIWYQARQTGGWTAWSLLLLFGHFFLPFLALLSRNVKRRKHLVVIGAAWILLMQWVDIYWLVMPAFSAGKVPLSVMDVTTFLGVGGVFLAAAVRRLGANALVPVRDPRLLEAVSFENM
jgi:hypothetical protein